MRSRLVFCVTGLSLALACSAATLDRADYTIQYKVVNTSNASGFMIGNFCTMGVRDQAKTNVAFIVQKRGACHVWDSGTILHGRREKNRIQFLVQDHNGKLAVENWPIRGSVAVN